MRFFEAQMDTRIRQRLALEVDLQNAILRCEFEVYYQPQINLVAGTIAEFEALLRWRHPTRGLVLPTEFIPLVEETGMIVPIGEWVLRSACLEAQKWPADIRVAVNLSPAQLKKGNVVAAVRGALEVSGLRPDRLELEITESLLIQDAEVLLDALRQLKDMGVTLALDNFGTGCSSLGYLRKFTFDKIKIDQSFVRDLVENSEAMAIVRAVTSLGQTLSMTTTAEGVETLEQLEKLREAGCTAVQGFIFSAPKPAREIPLIIETLHRQAESVT